MLAVIPAKIANAHLRNYIRRRLKAIFYEEKLYTQGYDFIIICKTPSLHIPFQKLKDSTLFGITRAIDQYKKSEQVARHVSA